MKHLPRIGAWIGALLLPPALSAQAPEITPAGDPSVLVDTIYALAIDPAERPEAAQVILLDDGVVVLERDGTATATYRTVVQALTREAVEGWGELTLGYDAVREDLRLNWARVVAPDGRVVAEQPAHQQVLDAPVAEASPVFTDRKRLRMSLAGLEPGMIVDYSYTTTTTSPARPGDFLAQWLISMDGGVRRSRYLLDVPTGLEPAFFESPATVEPVVTAHGERKLYRWSAADLPEFEAEYFEVRSERPGFQRFAYSTPGSWADVGAWYAGLANERYALTDEILEGARTVVGGAEGAAALQRLYRWVAQDFRYVSISLGIGGYQPRAPSDVFASRAGDCKDKATLFIALARHYGFEAQPVLLNSGGGVAPDLPSIRQFNHAIAAVRIGSEWVYLDLTATVIPFGELPLGYQGEFGLIVFDDGSVQEIEFPENAPSENVTHLVLEAELFEDGRLEGVYTERYSGVAQYGVREVFAHDFTPEEQTEIAMGMASVIEGAEGSDLEMFHGFDLEADVRVRVSLSSPRATRPNVGGGQIFFLPIDSYTNPRLLSELEGELPTREAPIDVDAVVGPIANLSELHLTLPEGWTTTLPPNVRAESRFGSYEATYAQEGRRVSVTRHLVGATGTAAASELPDLIEWLREMYRDDTVFLLLEPGSA